MVKFLRELRQKVAIGFVGGSDFAKISEQLAMDGRNGLCRSFNNCFRKPLSDANVLPVLEDFDFGFAENGLIAFRLGKPLATQSFIKFVGEEKYKKLVNVILRYLSEIDVPIKRFVTRSLNYCFASSRLTRGTFVEFRNGMVNVSPIGRNATYVSIRLPCILP